jgi:hypothetical protein
VLSLIRHGSRLAQKPVEVLDAEPARRHRRRDADEQARWHEEDGDGPVG